MKVVISAAGTGGHIYPAISIINKIKKEQPDSEILYIGTTDRMEKDIIPDLGIKYIGIDISGFSKNIFKAITSLYKMINGINKCKRILKEFKPDVVIGVGGYVTVPVIMAAHKLNIRTLLHEQNSIPGKANLFLEKYVDAICVSMEGSTKYFKDSNKIIYTGNPRGEEVLKSKKITKKDFGIDSAKKLVLITMGSLGSKTMNDLIYNSLNIFGKKDYEFVFVTGKKYYDDYKNNKYDNVKVVPYIDNMSSVLGITDLIISRAGATIISEITTLGVASILIPSPYVPNNHQYLNAKELVDNEATIMFEEKDFSVNKLIKEIDGVFKSKDKYLKIKTNAKKLGTPNSLSDIYNEILKLVK